MMLKRLLSLVLAGGLFAGCSDAKGSITAAWSKTKTTVNEAADSLTKPSPEDAATPDVVTAKATDERVAVPKDATECLKRGEAHKTLESYNIRITGTAAAEGGRTMALANDGRGANQQLQVGEYIGTQCWRVREIDHDYVLLEQPYKDAAGTEQVRTMQLGFDVKPAKELQPQQ